ncbi:MAG: putative catalase, partial [Ilumatobacteraceae bacterium]|nr:putative catalase [Ilumatobacteraceae bacterium]
EVEQVAYHVGHVVRGIEVTDDPLMQARLFSYLDTQLTRLGGPNFSQIPINRPHSPVNDNFRDGFHQQAVHQGKTPYLPNAVGGGCPFLAGNDDGGYIHMPRQVDGPKVRDRGPDDEYAQATLFWNSMSEVEQDHIVDAFTFELGHVEVPAVVERMVTRLSLIDAALAARICIGLGLPAPLPADEQLLATAADDSDGTGDLEPGFVPDASGGLQTAPSLAMITDDVFPVDGRVVQILANDGCDLNGIRALQTALIAAGVTPHVVATHKGAISGPGRKADELTVDRSFHTASSAEADAFIVAGGSGLADDPAVVTWLQSAYRHFKPIAAWGDGDQLLTNAGIPTDAPGVLVSPKANTAFAKAVVASLAAHRHWDRAATHPTRALNNKAV